MQLLVDCIILHLPQTTQNLESEIGRLREALTEQQQQQTPPEPAVAAAAADPKLAFERGLIRQMEADLAAKDEVRDLPHCFLLTIVHPSEFVTHYCHVFRMVSRVFWTHLTNC